ncbi:MAG: NAD(+)/NADH kinase [Ruminococcaceae bacterium]|nr:NAD(+)/NADH kinase [Oscillospiraceae bacterium]
MKKISLYPNPDRDPTLERTAKVIGALGAFSGELLLCERFRGLSALTPFLSRIRFVPEDELFRSDLLMTLGGDGTILSAAPRAAEAGIPIFGINFGNVGFMTSLEEKEIGKLSALSEKDLTVSSRMLLECSVGEDRFYALNEFVIAPEKGFHIVEMDLFTGRKKLCRFRADGLIFNTPTGSTGYSFSAGGAVQDADFDSIGVKAVSSYLLIGAHHMIFSPETVFTVKGAATEDGAVTVCADGRAVRPIGKNDVIKVRRAPHRLKLIFLKPKSNLEVFFRKF